MSKGYCMLSRELMESEDYFSERFTRMQAYMDLCFLASYKERKFIKRGHVVELKVGQLAKSEEELAERWKWSRNTVRGFLNEQQKVGNIEQQKSRLITIITVKFGLNIEQQTEQQTPSVSAQQIEQQIEQLQEIIYNKDKEIEEYKKELANASKKKDEESFIDTERSIALFENCWAAYGRKGSKKNSLLQWRKLTDEEKEKVMPHVKAYVTSREKQYQKDFERYLRDKIFNEVIIKGNETIFDPMRFDSVDEYNPLADGILSVWDSENKVLRFNNGDIDNLDDGYTSENRPEGATAAWGMYSWKWSTAMKEWVKQ